MSLTRLIILTLAAGIYAGLAGCAHLATPAEKVVSYRRFETLSVHGVGLSDFLEQRTSIIVAGAEPALIANRKNDVKIRFRPISADGFDIGSASAITPDGYFITAAHCIRRSPLYFLLSSEAGVKIAAARLVWRPAPNSPCDFALLKADSTLPRASFAMADDDQIRPDADVVTDGANGLAGGKILSESLASSADVSSATPSVLAIVHNAPLAEGDSGGPLATIDGKLIGIEVLARGRLLGQAQGIVLRPDPVWIELTIQKDRDAHWAATRSATRSE